MALPAITGVASSIYLQLVLTLHWGASVEGESGSCKKSYGLNFRTSTVLLLSHSFGQSQ